MASQPRLRTSLGSGLYRGSRVSPRLALHLFLGNPGHHKLFPVSCSHCGNTPLFSVVPQARRAARSADRSLQLPPPPPPRPRPGKRDSDLNLPTASIHSFSPKPRLACSSLLSRVKQAFLKHSSTPTSRGCLEDTSKHLSGLLRPLCYGCSPCHAVLPVFSPALLNALSLTLTTPLPCLSGCQSLAAS